jgi:hypothetical protein
MYYGRVLGERGSQINWIWESYGKLSHIPDTEYSKHLFGSERRGGL